jgi:hypothetical protein
VKIRIYSSERSTFKECLRDIKSQCEGFDYDFVILSVHPRFDIKQIIPSIKKILKPKDYMAFHSISVFKNNDIFEDGVTGLFFAFDNPKTEVEKFYIKDIERYETKNYIEQTAHYLQNRLEDFHLIFAGITKDNFTLFFEKLSDKLAYHPVKNIIGGISSGYKVKNELLTYQFVDNHIVKNGFVILSFKNLEAVIDISLGFIPYGIKYQITKAKDRKVYEVDGDKNFSKIMKRILKGIDEPDLRYLWYVPINILDEKDGYVATLRTIKDLTDDYVEFFAAVKEGQRFKISFATSEDILNANIECAKRLKRKMKHPELVLNFSCIARQYVLDDKQSEEIKIYSDIIKAPLFGFFTFGEIGPDKRYKNLKLYNETSVIIGMRERCENI